MIPKQTLSTVQLTVLTATTLLGVEFLILPRVLTVTANSTDGWLTIVVGALYTFILTCLALYFMGRHHATDLYTYGYMSFGKIGGTLLLFLINVYFWLSSSYQIAAMAEMIRFYLLPSTPTSLIKVLIFLLIAYLLSGSLQTILRVSSIIFPLTLLVAGTILLFSIKEMDIGHMNPPFTNGVTNVLFNPNGVFFPFAGIEIVYFLLPFVNKKAKVSLSVLSTLVLLSIIYIITYLIVVLNLGEREVKTLVWPTISFIQSFETEGIFIERMEGFLLSTWIMQFFSTSVIYSFLSGYSLRKYTKIKKSFSGMAIAVAISMVVCLYFQHTLDIRILRLMSFYGFEVVLLLPFIYFLIYSIKRKVVR